MRAYAFCPRCFDPMAIIEHNGETCHCTNCHAGFAFHLCQDNSCGLQGIPRQTWLPLAKPYISKACPLCGIAITIGEQLEKSSDFQTRSLGTDLVVLGVILGAAVILDGILQPT